MAADNNRYTHPKVRGGKPVGSRGGGCDGGSSVGKVSIDIGKQAAHHCRHTRTHVFAR